MLGNMTLGAVVSTGYHGSGMAFGALEEYVRRCDSTVISSVRITGTPGGAGPPQ